MQWFSIPITETDSIGVICDVLQSFGYKKPIEEYHMDNPTYIDVVIPTKKMYLSKAGYLMVIPLSDLSEVLTLLDLGIDAYVIKSTYGEPI